MAETGLPFDVSGKAEGTDPIVLVPGGLSGWVSWKPHAEILSKQFEVVRVQLLNMAAAERGEEPGRGYSLRAESEALGMTLDTLGYRTVNLVGWSHGGAVSLDFALDHPGRLHTLTLIEPAAYWAARGDARFAEEEAAFRRFFSGLHEPVNEEDLIGFLNLNGLVPSGADPRSMPRWPIWNSLKVALKSLNTVFDHQDEISRLSRLSDVPILLVKGRDSVGLNSGIVEVLSDAIGSTAKVLVLPDGHACHIVAMQQFINELKKHVVT